ncbi:Protein kinase subdomain-containing protein PKL CAK Fmp29 [Mycena sanguinolenta]|uniref:Protein kinase subdomain-containing protein PKL CAK Fmp29 n=1 Tax=Mycena sanguinolenta TaxID=230812 RepID=A0A8H6Z465_9AGAR|nr:Protein kinase subdomain-containing protein PKL CAK Fmp29 [Mycena sanguinolenta]
MDCVDLRLLLSAGVLTTFSTLKKLGEGGFNRTFLITMRANFQMVARIPYLPMVTFPEKLVVASEVATMDLLRSSGLPIPKVYGYSASTDNEAETEYILMEFVQGTNLSDLWFDLGEKDIISLSQQFAELESKMMSVAFPAGGSLYYSRELEKITGSPGIPLKDERFCVGPDTSQPLWDGRRAHLDVNRGPYQTAEAALVSGALKELAFLKQFGRPLLPFHRARREAYQYKPQPPSDPIENLERYLLIAPSLMPRDTALSDFRIRHPDLQSGNIIVNSNLHIVGLIDWQHTSILPLFLAAGIPERLDNLHDPVSRSMVQPSLPENFDGLDATKQEFEVELHRRRLLHYHYIKCTKAYNKTHWAALADLIGHFRRRIFRHASNQWRGESLSLKINLIDAMENWGELGGEGTPCPVVFDPADVRETRELDKEQRRLDETLVAIQRMLGYGLDGWVPVENYEEVMAQIKNMKETALVETESEEVRAEIEAHWPFDDIDEEEYM